MLSWRVTIFIQPVPTGRASGDPVGGGGMHDSMCGEISIQFVVELEEAHARQHVDASDFRFSKAQPPELCFNL